MNERKMKSYSTIFVEAYYGTARFKYGKDLPQWKDQENAALVLSLVGWAKFCQVETEMPAKCRISMSKV